YDPEIKASASSVDSYLAEMNEIVEKYYSTNLRRDLRMADYIHRIPLAIARASFSPITNDTLKEATSIISDSIATWHN
ncbi:MAG: hypothetical protein R6U21_06770, partial [Thermoplasmatota archaeon]